jgi:hypothetical protein
MQFIPFVRVFYASESPLFYNHRNCEGDVKSSPLPWEFIKGDPLGGALFALAHFKALHFIISLFFVSISIHYK